MLIHLIETQRHAGWHLGSTFWSAGAHVAVAAAVVAGAWTRPVAEAAPEREVIYLMPMLPSSPHLADALRLPSPGAPSGQGPARAARGWLAAGPENGASESLPQNEPFPVQAVVDSVERDGSAIYLAADLDRVVERDPSSAAPRYPEDLERARVEGGVAAEWVVDTLGQADTASFRVLATTHPQFASAVQNALPLMRFRPAELLGRKVQQMVRQEFTFRISLPAPDSSRRPRPVTTTRTRWAQSRHARRCTSHSTRAST